MRFILHFAVAVVTFCFGFAAERILIARKDEPPPCPVQKIERVVQPAAPVTVVTTPAPAPVALPTPNLIFDYEPIKFEPSGLYRPINRMPKEFREFDSFEIWIAQLQPRISGTLMLETLLNGEYVAHYATFALVTDRRLLFFTSSPTEERDLITGLTVSFYVRTRRDLQASTRR